MQEPAISPDEAARLNSLYRLGILDTPPEERFDRITRLASRLFQVPMALISLIDSNRQWFKSSVGITERETPRSISFCGHAILEDAIMVVNDTFSDLRFSDNPLVLGTPLIRFYAGKPLHAPDGQRIGTLCLMDTQPRSFSSDEQTALADLAAISERELQTIELQRALSREQQVESDLRETSQRLQTLVEHLQVGILVENEAREIVLVNQHFCQMIDDTIVPDQLIGMDCVQAAESLKHQFIEPERFMARFDEIIATGQLVLDDELRWVDGRIYVRDYVPIQIDAVTRGHLWMYRDVSDTRRVEQALRLSEDRYRSVVAAMHEGVVLQRADGSIMACNASAERILGVSADQMIGRTSRDLRWRSIREDGSPFPGEAHPAMVTLRSGRSFSNVVMGVYKPDGSLSWINVNSEPLFHPGKEQPYAVVVTFADITARRQAEAALAASELRLRTLISRAPVAIVLTDNANNLLFANRRFGELTGLPIDEIGQVNWMQIMHPHDQQRVWFELTDTLSRQPDASSEFRIILPDGSLRWIYCNVAAVHTAPDQTEEYISTLIDLTAHHEASEALRRSEAHQRALLNLIPDMLFHLDRQDRYLNYKAPRDAELLAPPEDFLGHTIHAILPPAILEPTIEAIQRARSSREIVVYEYQLARLGQVYDYEARVVSSTDDEVLLIVRDITERKTVERLKSEFVSTVSHELRTPLTSIRGALGLIVGGVAGEIPPQARAMLEIAHKNSERLVRLINDILDIEKIESGTMSFDLQVQLLLPLVEQAIEATRAFAEGLRVQYQLHAAVTDVQVMVDGDRLIQVFTNLLSNAAKFSPAGETVRISIERLAGLCRISVADNGPGISEAFRSRIFQRFAQADSSDSRQQGGTGLGLSIARAITERLQGQIGFSSLPGRGTTFFVDLPEHQSASEQAALSTFKPRVLICEDEPGIATLLKYMLQQAGYATDIAGSAEAARQFLLSQQYAAMTLDMVLPGENGAELLRWVRSTPSTYNLPVIIVSAITDQHRRMLNGEAFAVIDWLDKPIDEQRLLAAIERSTTTVVGRRPCVLHVEDDQDIVQIVEAILQPTARVMQAANLAEARYLIPRYDFDVAILDLALPDGNGLELLPLLRDPDVPVVIFSIGDFAGDPDGRIDAALVKSRTSNKDLLDTIIRVLKRHASELRGSAGQ